ncbi:nucleoside permease [Granulicella arctica]|uniref:Nucleoside transporter n=1 Tax=Granulicella arctica TaxID=940613 RepID=A0A7Y9PHC0_9BACT|nr:nucleoside permease [Granulicella arctica]NYF79909.1 nucleoside transporter [Granulicella arctica]
MNAWVKPKLAAMMFLEYFIWGVWYVTVGTWLGQHLHFTGAEIGLVAGTTAIGAIFSPFLAGWIADNLLPTQYVLAILHSLGGILLLLAASRTSFAPLYVLVLLYAVCYMPTLSLTTALAFRHIRDPKMEFGPIRVLGSAGWIVAGLLVGGLKIEATALPMQLAAGASFLMAIYCFVLPHTPPLATPQRFAVSTLFPKDVLGLFRQRSFAIFVAASFLICIPLQFYYAFTNLFLNQIGIHNAAGKMTGGQMSELACMLLIPWFFQRLGVKYMLVAGMSAWVLRYALFAYGNGEEGMWMLWGGIILHGICYDFFFVTGQIYVDRKAPVALRAAAQGMITLITYGAGMLVGSWLSGIIVDHYATTFADGSTMHQWRSIWLVASACSAAVLIVFLFTFSDRSSESDLSHTLPDVTL